MPHTTNTFSYTPLDKSKREIRLLVLLERRWRSKILPAVEFAPRCRLEHATYRVIKFGTYEALSYTWGQPNTCFPPRFITLNGAKFEVGENLYHALRFLTLNSGDRVLWVDAICINQNDPSEKNHQVQQMGDIYRMAYRVVVWLGRSSAGTKKAFKFINQHNPYEESPMILPNGRDRKGDAKDKWRTSAIKQLKDVCERDYWSRVWIIQEIGLASELHVACGNYHFPWDSLDRVLKAVGPSMPTLVASLGWLQAHRQGRQGGSVTLQSLLIKFESSLCKVPHDKIYGFAGLASDWAEASIPIDYNKSLLRLHGDVLSFYSDRAFQSGAYSFREDRARQYKTISKHSKAKRRMSLLSARARPEPSTMGPAEFHSNVLQLSWLIWNQLATSRPDLVLAKQIFPSANRTARQIDDAMFQQVAEAVQRTFIKVGVNEILPFWLFLLTKSELLWMLSCLENVESPNADSTADFCHFCRIKKYEFDLEVTIERFDNPQKLPLRTTRTAPGREPANYHVFTTRGDIRQIQGNLFWTTNFYVAPESEHKRASYNDFERGWFCFRKHSNAAPVKHRGSKAGSVPGDLGFDRQKLDDWASSESGIGYSLVLPRHRLNLYLTTSVFTMCCKRETIGDFFSGQLPPRIQTKLMRLSRY